MAARIADLGWAMIIAATAVCVAVLAALGAALFRRRPAGAEAPLNTGDANASGAYAGAAGGGGADGSAAVVLFGMALPAVIIALTLGFTIYTLREVAGAGGPGAALGTAAHGPHHEPGSLVPTGVVTGAAQAIAIQVTGHQWWWEVSYPDEQVVTANEVHVPAGVLVRLSLTSTDVIHSFWVPQVAGKVDVIPRKTNVLTVRIDQPGEYRGLCAEFCGLQHAHMHFRLIVEPPADFAAWLATQRQAPPEPTDSLVQQGQRVFARASCAECHTVRGVTAGRRGPDLTHVASRRTLGAGTHENTSAALSGWVANPQAMKPGNRMPPTDLSPGDVRAVVAYVGTLE
jgi:cytochrome c oxidase subunit 2